MWTGGFKLFPKYQRKQDKGNIFKKKGTGTKRETNKLPDLARPF